MQLYREEQKLNTCKPVPNRYKKQDQALLEKRKQQPYKITVGQMPKELRYNKLKTGRMSEVYVANLIKKPPTKYFVSG